MREYRRKYSAAFKREAIEYALQSDKSLVEIERELGITKGLLRQWTRRAKMQGEKALRSAGEFCPESEEVRRLKQENESLRLDNEILKKAIAICTQPPKPGSTT
jgi:transposase